MKRYWFATVALASLFACRKEMPFTHVLSAWQQSPTIMIHQGITIYDSTALNDSLLFALPPTDRIYRWSVSPDSAGVHFTGDYLHGEATVIFDHGGAYTLSARIYDSVTNGSLARTNTLAVQVLPDTLYPEYPLFRSDQLTFSDYSFGHSLDDTATLDYSFFFGFTTTDRYLYAYTIPYQLGTGNGITVVFSDSVVLASFPFNFYDTVTAPTQTFFGVQNIPIGSTQPFSITWLDETYTGTISRPIPGGLSFTWNNTGPVKIIQGGVIQAVTQ